MGAGTRSRSGLIAGGGLALLTAVLVVALSQASPGASDDGAGATSGNARIAQVSGLTADASPDGAVTLMWAEPETVPAEPYLIDRDGNDVGSASPGATSFEDEPPSDGTYTYTVDDHTEPASVDVTVATPRLPPQNLTANAVGDTVALDWDGPDQAFVDGFRVYRDGTPIATTTNSDYDDTNLGPGTYDYEVTTVHELDETVESAPAGPVSATILGLNVTADVDGATVTVSWNDVCEREADPAYRVQRGDAFSTNTDTTTFQETLAEGTYTYTVTEFCGETTDSVTVTVDLAPPAPEGLTATASGDTATLDWDAVAGADSYGVYRAGTRIATTPSPGFEDPGLADGTHTYTVTAIEDGQESPPSNPADAVIVTPPPPPQSLTATVEATTVTLTWEPPDDAANVGGYRVYRDGSPIGRTGQPEFEDAGLDQGTHTYSVTAVHELDDGVESPPSEPARADVLIPPDPPRLQASVDGDTVTLTWQSPPGAGGHRIYRDGVQLAQRPGTARTYVDGGVPEGTHIYRVSVVHRLDPSMEVPSNPARVEIEAPPAPPAPRITARRDGGDVVIDWTWSPAPGGPPAAGFTLFRDGAATAIPSAGSRTTRDVDVAAGSHTYWLFAHDTAGRTSPASNRATVPMPPPEPADGDPSEPTTPSPDPGPPPAADPGPVIDPTPLTDPQPPADQPGGEQPGADGGQADGDGADQPDGDGADGDGEDGDGDGEDGDGEDGGDEDGGDEPAELDIEGPAVSSGAQVGVSGAFCGAEDDVAVAIDGTQVATTTADGDGAFDVAVDAPAGAGRHDVTVTCDGTTATSPLDVVVTTNVGGAATSTVGTVLAFFVFIGLVLWPRATR